MSLANKHTSPSISRDSVFAKLNNFIAEFQDVKQLADPEHLKGPQATLLSHYIFPVISAKKNSL